MLKNCFLFILAVSLLSCCYDLCELEINECSSHSETEECCEVEKETTVVKQVSPGLLHFVIVDYPLVLISCDKLYGKSQTDINAPPNYITASSLLI